MPIGVSPIFPLHMAHADGVVQSQDSGETSTARGYVEHAAAVARYRGPPAGKRPPRIMYAATSA